jgi:hypothetical protein
MLSRVEEVCCSLPVMNIYTYTIKQRLKGISSNTLSSTNLLILHLPLHICTHQTRLCNILLPSFSIFNIQELPFAVNMRISLDSIAIAALLAGIPFASVVRSYPTGGYINVVDTSKRGIPKPGGAPTNPFKTPFDTPSPPLSHSSPGGAAAGWRNFADGDLTLANAAQDKVRLKGQGYIQDLENAITHQSPSKNVDSVIGNGYLGQGNLKGPPELKIQQQQDPYAEFGVEMTSRSPVQTPLSRLTRITSRGQ